MKQNMNEQTNTLPVNALNAKTPIPPKKTPEARSFYIYRLVPFFFYNFPDRIASVAVKHKLISEFKAIRKD